jgi:hypothetical protein
VAMAVRDQCAARRRRPRVGEARAASDPARRPSFRLAQRRVECLDPWRVDHRHRRSSPVVRIRRSSSRVRLSQVHSSSGGSACWPTRCWRSSSLRDRCSRSPW